MSIQRINIQLPQKLSFPNPFISRPCSPIPYSPQSRPPLARVSTSPGITQSIILNGPRSISPPSLPLQINRSAVFVPNNGVAVPPSIYYQPQPIQQNITNPNMSTSFTKINVSQNQSNRAPVSGSRQNLNSSKTRPNSPKIQFKYVSPSKQDKQLSEINENSNLNSIEAQESHQKHSNARNNELKLNSQSNSGLKTPPQPFNIQIQPIHLPPPQYSQPKPQIVQNSIQQVDSETKIINSINPEIASNHNIQSKSLLSNYIYMIDKNENEKKQEEALFREVENVMIQKENIAKQVRESIEKQQTKQILKQQHTEIKERRSQQRGQTKIQVHETILQVNSSSEIENNRRLKKNDEQLKNMMEEYESLKQMNDNELPRVQKNSSDENQNQQEQNYKRNERKVNHIDNQSSYKGGSFGHLTEAEPKVNDDTIRYKSNSSNSKNRDSLAKNLFIKQQTQFEISGVENIRSQVFQGRISLAQQSPKKASIKTDRFNDQQNDIQQEDQTQNEKQSEYQMKLEQKDIEIKNLKNQVWLMKLREKQLLNTIKRLEKVSRDQMVTINRLRNKQE